MWHYVPRFGGPAGPPFATHWRIVFLANVSDRLSFAEVELAGSASGADQCSGGTPSLSPSSSTQANAVDNDLTTHVSSDFVSETTWQYTFASPVNVAEVRFTCRNTSGQIGESPVAFVVQASTDSGSTWATYAWCFGTAWASASEVQSYAVGTTAYPNLRAQARAWRVKITAINSAASFTRCSQLIWATTASGAQAATGGFPLVGSNAQGSPDGISANIMNSGDAAHRTATTGQPFYYGYSWQSVFASPVECRYRADGSAGDLLDYPNALEIQWTADGATWTTTDSYTSITGWASGAEKTFAITG